MSSLLTVTLFNSFNVHLSERGPNFGNQFPGGFYLKSIIEFANMILYIWR